MKMTFLRKIKFLLLALGLTLTGCNDKTILQQSNLQISFVVDNSVYKIIETNGNELLVLPSDPVKDGFTFDGWYLDNNIWKERFTVNSLLNTPISSNINVYAHFLSASDLTGTEINIKDSTKLNIEGVGDVFYLNVPNNHVILKFDDYVECCPTTTWSISKDIEGNNVIKNKNVELIEGDNPFYYIYVTDKNEFHSSYIVFVHRNRMFNVFFNGNGGTSPNKQIVEEGNYLENIPSSERKGYTFLGWDYNFLCDPITDNVFANAKWSGNEFKISYYLNGGSASRTTQIVTFGCDYRLEVPEKKGYRFCGWTYKGNTFPSSGVWDINENIELYAQWEIINYSIAYELNGGRALISLKYSFTVEDTFTIPCLEKTGYVFDGWSTSPAFTDVKKYYTVEAGTIGNIKLYAKFSPRVYKINLDVNGGNSLDESVQDVVYNTNLSLPTPSREGYEFNGWYYKNSKISNNSVWTTSSDATLTAHWNAIEYSIGYQLNGGTNNIGNPKNYTIESNDIVLLNPTKKGYTFLGWTSSSVLDPTISLTIKKGSVGNLIFTANWKQNTYHITYDVNGGDYLSLSEDDVLYDGSFSGAQATRTGYTFAGWYDGDDKINDGVWKIDRDVNLVAKWTPNNYWIIKHDGAKDTTEMVSYDSAYKLVVPTKIGFNFIGYYTEHNGGGIKYTDNKGNSISNYTELKNIELYAYYTYTLKFVSNGGTVIPDLTFDDDEILSKEIVPTRENYTFGGWYIDEKLTKPFDYSVPSGRATLYAKWNEETDTSLFSYVKENGGVTINGSSFEGQELVIPSYIAGLEVKKIASKAFSNLSVISVNVPEVVEIIENAAFYKCDFIEEMILPFIGRSMNAKGYEAVFGYIFGYTYTALETDSSAYYDRENGWYCNKNYGVRDGAINQYNDCPDGKGTYYPHKYWYYVPALLSKVDITLQTDIPLAAFNNCTMIEEINLSSLTSAIRAYAFMNCESLQKMNSNLNGSLNIPENVKNIEKYAFYHNISIEKVCLSNDIGSLGAYSFAESNNIKCFNSDTAQSLIIPSKCEFIGQCAFLNLKEIKTILVPDCTEIIEEAAFKGCILLETISLPFIGKSMTAKGHQAVFGYIFGYTYTALETDSSAYYDRENGWYCNKNYGVRDGAINQYNDCPDGKGTYYPHKYWFHIPSNLKNVYINVQDSIPLAAFNRCTMLENIYLVSSIKSEGAYAYQDCTANISYTVNPSKSGAWDGSTVASSFASGDGTKNNPYQIFSPSEFVYFINEVNSGQNYEGKHFILTSDINFGNYLIDQIAPLESLTFKGNIDGNGKSIKNFKITSSESIYNGLFGYMDGEIFNLNIRDCCIELNFDDSSEYYCGLFVGNLIGKIQNIQCSGTIKFTSKKTCYVGGLVGLNAGIIESCQNLTNVEAASTNSKCYVAGISGYNKGTVNECSNSGVLVANGYSSAYSFVNDLIGFNLEN